MDPIRLLEFLSSKPQLLVPLLLVLLICPITRLVVRLLDNVLTTDNLTKVLPQAVAFVLLVHIAVSIAAIFYCWGFTDLPVPMVRADAPAPFGREVMRNTGYVFPLSGAMFPMIGLSLPKRLPSLFGILGFLRPKMALFGVLGSILLICYAALIDPSILSPAPQFANEFDAVAWWYTIVPITTVSVSMAGFVFVKAVQLIWWLADKSVDTAAT